jgi:hypothetical protein
MAVVFFSNILKAEINDIEFGVANYSLGYGNSEHRFDFLIQSVADLIKKDGDDGIIYLNDIEVDGLEFAYKTLSQWLKTNGYFNIKLIMLPGDYTKINLPLVRSAHLGNPSWMQLPSNSVYEYRSIEITAGLLRLAAHSETGLKITSYYNEGRYDHIHSLREFVKKSQKGEFIESQEAGHPYLLQDGTSPLEHADFTKMNISFVTKVYILKSNEPAQDSAELDVLMPASESGFLTKTIKYLIKVKLLSIKCKELFF